MSIAAANVAPNFLLRRSLIAEDLTRLQQPALIFEHEGLDSDMVRFYCYTVAGWLDGQNIADIRGGATVGGQVIVVNAESREHADYLAGEGLMGTIDALHREAEQRLAALAAQARLASIGAIERISQATRKDKNADFIDDVKKIRPLAGDDVVLAAGGVIH